MCEGKRKTEGGCKGACVFDCQLLEKVEALEKINKELRSDIAKLFAEYDFMTMKFHGILERD